MPLGAAPDMTIDDRAAAIGALLRAQIEELLGEGRWVTLVYPVPEVGWEVPERLAREAALGIRRNGPLSTSAAVYGARAAMLDAVGDAPGLTRVRPAAIFCALDDLQGRCVAERDGHALYFDDDHPSGHGAALIAARIAAALDIPQHAARAAPRAAAAE
jgi:hypothetical protein